MRFYYVTAVRAKRVAWLYGPIADHGVALAFVPYIRRLACSLDPWCDFDAFGTSSIEVKENAPPGRLNAFIR